MSAYNPSTETHTINQEEVESSENNKQSRYSFILLLSVNDTTLNYNY